MSAPQSPADDDPTQSGGSATSDSGAGPGSSPTYDFHGEKLDFDPYRFGAPEQPAPTWGAPPPPPPPGTDPARPPAPGDRWAPGGDPTAPEVRPGDYWQGGGSDPRAGDVFPPAGYAPPPSAPGGPGVDLGKPAAPSAPSAPPPSGYPPSYPGYGPPGGYPGSPTPFHGGGQPHRTSNGNRLATVGFGLALLGCVLFFTSIIALALGGTGLGLSIAGLVRARRGAPHRTFAILGIVFGIVAVAAAIGFIAYAFTQYDITCLSNLGGNTGRIEECRK